MVGNKPKRRSVRLLAPYRCGWGRNERGAHGHNVVAPVLLLSIAARAALTILMLCFTHAAFAQNPTAAENSLAGTGSWRISKAAASHQLEGYANLASVNKGGNIQFFVSTTDPSYTLTIYRMGFYHGLGGRQMTHAATLVGHHQAIPGSDPVSGLTECRWSFPYTVTIPTNWVSGEYLAKLTGSNGEQAYVPFVVRDDARGSHILVASSTNTVHAYSNWGGKSLYCNSNSTPVASVTVNPCVSSQNPSGIPAVKISYNRPYQGGWGAGQFFPYDYYLIYWLEGEGYDVDYTTNVDIHNAAGLFSSTGQRLHKAFISMPHDEYWTYQMRHNVTTMRDKGVGLVFLGSDTGIWQIRYESSPHTGASNRTIVAYKNNWPNDPDAKSSATYYLVTDEWRLARYTYPGHPEEALVGVQDTIGDDPLDAPMTITNPSAWPLSSAGLRVGEQIPHMLGYEVDSEQGHQPANTTKLAHSPYPWKGQTHYSDMTMYQAASGAWVFATGTMNWVRFLDNASPYNDCKIGVTTIADCANNVGVANPVVQEITRTVLERMIQ